MKLLGIFRGKKDDETETVIKAGTSTNGKKNTKNVKSKKAKTKRDALTIDTADKSVCQEGMPRISMALTMSELQDEAMARGIERQFLPTNKESLLEFLVDGSIYLRKTRAWMDVERLKGEMAADCRRIEEENHSRLEAASGEGKPSRQPYGEDRSSLPQEDDGTRAFASSSASGYDNKMTCDNTASLSRSDSDDDDHTPPSTAERTNDDLTDDDVDAWKREHSMMDMSSLHSPTTGRYRGHAFKLANRSSSFQSSPLEDTSVLGSLMKIFPLSCTTCRTVNIPNTKEAQVVEKNDLQKEQKVREAIQRRNQWKPERTKEQMELQQKWDASVQFEAWIITPPDSNKTPKGSMMKGYTVWCSIATSGVQFPPKRFDATYRHLNDANSRARFLFYWRNPWHLSPNKMSDSVLIKSDNSAMSGCASTFHCVHPNGDKWIVSVVNDSTFKYLDDASSQRHDLDCELL
jgi:hypothetical protein